MNEQGTQAWKDERAGNATASHISEILSKAKKGSGESAGRANYRARLVCEILSGRAMEDEYESWDMKRGTELEPTARAEYEIRIGTLVDTAGFVLHPSIPRFGASVDGLVGKDGLVQFKCPKTATHLEWLRRGIVPAEHKKQMLGELSCYPDRLWNEFVSYDPKLPPHLRLFMVKLHRNQVEIEEVEHEVIKFNLEVDELIRALPAPDHKDRDLTEEWTDALHDIQAQKSERNAQEIS